MLMLSDKKMTKVVIIWGLFTHYGLALYDAIAGLEDSTQLTQAIIASVLCIPLMVVINRLPTKNENAVPNNKQ